MTDEVFSQQVAPLIIRNQGDKNGEHFDLDGLYLLTLEQFDADRHVIYHTMAAPGFVLCRSGYLLREYHPDSRPLHRHGCLELMYVLQGEVTQYIEDRCLVYTAGQCCILSRNTRHVESFSSDFEACFLMLSDDFLKQIMEQDLQFSGFSNYRPATNPLYQDIQRLLERNDGFHKKYLDFYPLPSGSGCEEAKALLTSMITETQKQQPGFIPLISGYIARLLSLLANPQVYAYRQVDLKGSREDFIFNSVRRYLTTNHGRVNYDELENMLHYTRDYLNRIIRRHSGMSLVELGQSICLEEAACMLRHTDKSISEIMQTLNYSNRTYFYRIFREKYGMTPKEYRNK